MSDELGSHNHTTTLISLLSQDGNATSASSNVKMEPAARDLSGPATANNHAANQAAYTTTGFASHSRSPSDGQGGGQGSPIAAAHSLPHGYNHAPPAQNESHIHPELRSSTDVAAPTSAYPAVPILNMMPASLSPDQSTMMSSPATAIGVPPGGVDHGESSAEGRKAKRELSQSKRAAQNRAAQRAFRQRKEGYIKKLEQQVRDFAEVEVSLNAIRSQNDLLRDYALLLQTHLMEARGDYPPPPPGLNLAPQHGLPSSAFASDGTSTAAGSNAIDVAAQAVAGLNRSDQLANRDYKYEHRVDDDARTAEELARQLTESGSDTLPSAPM